MPDVLSFNPSRALDAAADGSPGAKAYFYDSGTTTLRTVYSDAACTVPHASPLVADATGRFAAVFSNAAAIKVVVTDSADATLYTLDPCIRVPASGAAASAISFTPTIALPFDNVQAAIEGSVAAAASGFNAFGVGVTGSVALMANLDATNLASGQYRFDGTTTGTYPSGVVAADTGAIVLVRETSSSAWMYLYHDTTDRFYYRRMNASVWGTWREGLTANQGFVAGDLIYHNGTNLVRLAKGTALQGLRMNAGATAPEWGDQAIGVGQTWQNVTGSRVAGTSYQNTTGKPISLAVSGNSSGSVQYFQTSVDNATWTNVALLHPSTAQCAGFIVPNNWYYRFNGTLGSINTWAELR